MKETEESKGFNRGRGWKTLHVSVRRCGDVWAAAVSLETKQTPNIAKESDSFCFWKHKLKICCNKCPFERSTDTIAAVCSHAVIMCGDTVELDLHALLCVCGF